LIVRQSDGNGVAGFGHRLGRRIVLGWLARLRNSYE